MLGALADTARLLGDPAAEPRGALPPEAVRLLRAAAEAGSAGETANSLAERFTDSVRRAGSDLVTSSRIVRAVRHFVGDIGASASWPHRRGPCSGLIARSNVPIPQAGS
jgi:hypothetical protein